MHCYGSNLIKDGDYVIIKRKHYMKVHKVSESSIFTIGKDEVETNSIIGKPFCTMFEVVPSKGVHKLNTLQLVTKAESFDKLRFVALKFGVDNRLINDNGTSQQLSKENILDLRKSGKSGKEIVQTLIQNSTSFSTKTEYSQEKYIRKKGNKYFQYFTICKPTIKLLQEIYFRQDFMKINSMRMDTLAQILSYSDVKSDGIYLLYDSGSLGLIAASILNRVGVNTSGCLINLHPGYEPQTTVIKAMNFPLELQNRLTNINIRNFLQNQEKIANLSLDANEEHFLEIPNNNICKQSTLEGHSTNLDSSKVSVHNNPRKRINSVKQMLDTEFYVPEKKSKICTFNRLNSNKADGLIIVVREHPLNIIESLIHLVKKSRPFVIFHSNREPLQDTYVVLKQKYHVINLNLYNNFLRSYQILTERTHPDILKNNSSGYFLTGYLTK